MYRVEFYAAVRRSVYVEGLSERAAARRFGLARETVRKMLRTACRPGIVGRNRSGVRNWTPSPGSSIKSSPTISSAEEQRHTAKRIWERFMRRARLHGRLHDCQRLRAQAEAGRARDVRAARASAGRRPRPTSAKPWWSSTASNARRTTWSWICRTATTRSCRRFRPRRRRRFCEGHKRRVSATSAACRVASSTTTPRWRWRRFSGTARGSERRASASFHSHYLFRRSLRTAGEGQRQRQGGRAGRLRPPKLLRAGPARR